MNARNLRHEPETENEVGHILKDQICNHDGCEEIDNKQDTLGLLKII